MPILVHLAIGPSTEIPRWPYSLRVWGGFMLLLLGVALLSWSSSRGRGVVNLRPVSRRAVLVVRSIIVALALVVPVLLSTIGWFLVFGFSARQGLIDAGWVAIVIVPLWSFLACVVSVLERAKWLALTFLILLLLQTLMDATGIQGLLGPWTNTLATESNWRFWFPIWVPCVLILVSYRWLKKRAELARVLFVVGFVLSGWGATAWYLSEGYFLHYPELEARKVELQLLGEGPDGNPEVGFRVPINDRDLTEGALSWVTAFDGTLMKGDRRFHKEGNGSGWLHPYGSGWFLHTSGAIDPTWEVFGELLRNENALTVEGPNRLANVSNRSFWDGDLQFQKNGSIEGWQNGVSFQGELLAHAIEYEKVADLPAGKDAEVSREGLTLRYEANLSSKSPKNPRFSVEEVQRSRLPSYVNDVSWLFVFVSESGDLVLSANLNGFGVVAHFAGVQIESSDLEFKLNPYRGKPLTKDEYSKGRLMVFRTQVRRVGRLAVNEEVGAPNPRTRQNPYYGISDVGPSSANAALSLLADSRPEVEGATKEQVGGRIRQILSSFPLKLKGDDLAEFAIEHGELLLEAEVLSRDGTALRAFEKGAGEELKGAFIERLELLPNSAMSTLVERGWGEDALPKIETLIAEGRASENVLRLGIYLGSKKAIDAGLARARKSAGDELVMALSEVAGLESQLSEALEASIPQVKGRLSERILTGRGSIETGGWAGALRLGNRKMLEAFLESISLSDDNSTAYSLFGDRTKRDYFILASNDSEKKWSRYQAEDFQWDGLREKWIYQERGESQ
ncbi:hypothetical protein [Roseibacillus persicicus]|uniref:hypothetical protein n=2 Tax=Roseibacillus persicicus TaxID=454148 RepID=UPI00167B9236|nr:hypothetical protein [Roseibacillus persicicus]